MWDHFSKDFKYAIDEPVPIETVRVRRDSQPPWFDRQAMKLYKKTAKTTKITKKPEIHTTPKCTDNKREKNKADWIECW